eukprot:PhM_4_TR4260/c0_g1_i2/m.13530
MDNPQLREEMDCVSTITRSLKQALVIFTSLPSTTTHQNNVHTTTIDEVIEFMEVVYNVVAADPAATRLRILLCETNSDLIPVLFQYTTAQYVTAPGHPVLTASQSTEAFQKLRAVATQVVCKFIALCSNDHVEHNPVANVQDEAVVLLSRLIGDTVIRCNGLDTILNLVMRHQTAEELKLPAVECLFVMLMRNLTIQLNFVQRGGVVGAILEALTSEPLLAIRNYLCACVRELSNAHAPKLVLEGAPDTLLHLGSIDLSPDVRALSIETFDVIAKNDPNFWRGYAPAYKELASLMVQRLDRETNPEVIETMGKLLETCFRLDYQMYGVLGGGSGSNTVTFTDHFTAMQGERPLVQCLKHAPRAASMVARALRFLIQYAPHYREVGQALVGHFPSVSLVLKIVIDLASDMSSKSTLAHQVLRVELSIALALCFAQSPLNRDTLRRELGQYPGWMSSLREALVKHLNNASLEYYADIPIVDTTGVFLNNSNIEELWEAATDRPSKAAVKELFIAQEHRAATQPLGRSAQVPTYPNIYAEQSQRPVKLTFVILSYATHLALHTDEVLMTDAPTAVLQAGQPAPHTMMPSTHPQDTQQYYMSEQPTPMPSNSGVQTPRSVSGAAQPFGAVAAPPGGWADQRGGMAPPPVSYAASPPRDPARGLPSSMHYYGVPSAAASQYVPHEIYRDPHNPHSVPARDLAPGRMTPAPTRTSILREERSNPYRTQSMMRMSQNGTAAGRHYSPAAAARSLQQMRARSPAAAAVRQGQQGQDPAVAELFSKFDAAFSLCTKFSLYYRKKEQPKAPVYTTTPDGFVVRQSRTPTPWNPALQKPRLKAWSVKDIKEGDLFFFSIPFQELCAPVVQKVLERAQKHARNVKRMFVTTPQVAKGRRWFLYDLQNHVMPKIMETLSHLHNMIVSHGEENIKFPVFMFREKEINLGQRAVHCGNILEMLEQIKYYFEQQPAEVGTANNQYLRDIEDKIRALSQQQYSGKETADISDTDDDEDEDLHNDSDEDIFDRLGGGGGGHGGLDSDASTVSSED